MSQDLSLLTPLQLTATANLLYNQGLGVNTAFTTAVTSYNNLPLVGPLFLTINYATANPAALPAATKAQLYTLGSSSVPALSDSVPAAGLTNFANVLMSNLLLTTANTYMGNGDLSKFSQGLSAITSYAGLTNIFVNSANNSQTYLGNTYTTMNNMVTGQITAVNLCANVWGPDLANLGGLINLADLDNLGSPIALVNQLASFGGITPTVTLAFANAGISSDAVVNLNNPTYAVTDADQRAIYAAMTQITGTDLQNILRILGVTTANITTMADLLDPVKLFPNSFQTLTVTDMNGTSKNIYINSAGTVNPTLAAALPTVATSSIT